jgi:DnaJ-class molecular chaperone
LKGYGLPDMKGSNPGDLYVTVHIQLPKELTPEQRDQLKAIRSPSSASPS